MAVAVSHTASFEYAAVDTDHDEAGVAIGAAAADRLVFVCVAGLGTASTDDINTMSIGGQSATRARRDSFAVPGLGGFASMEIWWALVTTGTTATISFTHDANLANQKFSVYAVTGADTATPINDSDFASRSDAITNAVSVSVDVLNNGGAIGLAAGDFASTSVSVAWTYLSENLDNDLDLGGFFAGFSTASISSASASSGQAVTATFTDVGPAGVTNRGLTVATLQAVATTTNADVSGAGTGTATAVTGVVASVSGSSSGTATATADSGGITANAAGTSTATAVSAVIASSAGGAAGAAIAIATSPVTVVEAPDYAPVGGGGGFGPPRHGEAQRFRTRKDKSKPKVITVRIGEWPEDPQIILERQEKAEREDFHRRLANRPDDIVVESVDEDEQALLEILAFAA